MKRLLTPLLLALCASLLGCAASGPYKNKMEPDPVMAGLDARIDVSEHVNLKLDQNCSQLGTALQGNVKISESGRLAVYAHCAALCDAQLAAKEQTGATQVCGSSTSNPWLAKVADQSFKQIRRSCDAWFNVLEKQRIEIQYNQTNANVASGAIATVLAAAGGHTRAVFNLAAVTTMGNAMVENYKASFLFTPELAKLHDKVSGDLFDAKQQAILTKLGSSNGYSSWGQLVSDIADFEELCSHKRIVEIMNKAIDIAKFSFAPVGISVEAQNTANELKKSIGDAMGKINPQEKELMNLASLAELPLAKRKTILDYLKEPVEGKTNANLLDGSTDVEMSTLLQNATKLKLGESDNQIRPLQRLAETLQWIGTSDFNLRVATYENLVLSIAVKTAEAEKAAAKKPPTETGAPAAAATSSTSTAVRSNTPRRSPAATAATAITSAAADCTKCGLKVSEAEIEMAKNFRKSVVGASPRMSNQIIATPAPPATK